MGYAGLVTGCLLVLQVCCFSLWETRLGLLDRFEWFVRLQAGLCLLVVMQAYAVCLLEAGS